MRILFQRWLGPVNQSGVLPAVSDHTQAAPALAKTKLLFGITTPMLCNEEIDAIQAGLNKQAAAIMAAAGIPTVDLYAVCVFVSHFTVPP